LIGDPLNGKGAPARDAPPTRSPRNDRPQCRAWNGRCARIACGSYALAALHELELALDELAALEPRGGELALVLAVARDRIDRHHVQPHAPVLEEWGLAA
jgi:hypothetical protein